MGIALIEGVLLLLLVYTSVDYLKRSNQEQIAARAQATGALFSAAAKDAIISTDLSTLQELADELIANTEVKYVKVFGQNQLLASAGEPVLLTRLATLDANVAAVDDGILDINVDVKASAFVVGHVKMGFSIAKLDEYVVQASTRIGSIAALEMILVALFSWLLGMYLTRNLSQLKRASQQILQGETLVQIPVVGKDEIAQTTAAFNDMSAQISTRTHDLESANTRLNTILSAAIDGYIIINTQGIITQVNPAVSRVFGYDSEELIGENVAIFLPAPDRHRHDGYIQHYLDTGAAGIIGKGREVTAQHKDGHLFQVDLSVSRMEIEEELMFLGLVKDLTDIKRQQDAAKRSEAILLATLDASQDALITIDISGRVLEFNDAAVGLFGYTREQAIGETLEDLIIPPEYHQAHAMGMEHYRRTGEGPVLNKQIEVTALTKDRTPVPVEMTIIPIQLGDDVLMTAFLRDITERKQIEDKLKLAKQQAEMGSKAKSRFLATMSHEIRSPLNAVLGSVDLLLDSELDQDQQIYARTANEAGSALLSTINDILDFSKIEAGQMVLTKQTFTPAKLVTQVLQVLAPKALEKGIHLASFINRNVPDYLVGDEQRLRQVIHNLVDNAIKFSESGCISVQMWIPDSHAEDIQLCCKVEDQGIGIPEADQQTLFNEFSQVHDENNTSYKGTGLGLAICAELIHMMGGEISLKSELGQGTCFEFDVRLQLDEKQPLKLLNVPSHCRVLLVHPDATLSALMKKQYSQHGVQLISVTQVEQVYKTTVVKGRFNLILVDDSCLFDLDNKQINLLSRDFLFSGGMICALVSSMSRDISQLMASIGLEQVVNKPISREMLLGLLNGQHAHQLTDQGAVSIEDESIDTRVTPAGVRLLLAEDSKANQLVAGALLSKAGYQVDFAKNGQEALEMALSHDYQLILMDMRMPQMDGLDSTRHIMQQKPSQLIVAMSANVLKQDVEQCFAAGMQDFISKPVKREELLETVAKWVQHQPTEPIEEQATAPESIHEQLWLDTDVVDELLAALSEESVQQMMSVFIIEAEERLGVLKQAQQRLQDESFDFDLIETQAHTLKSSAGSFGASALFEISKTLESAAREKQVTLLTESLIAIEKTGTETLRVYRQKFGGEHG
nr:PAS domain S-box protein [Shewanella gelidii]